MAIMTVGARVPARIPGIAAKVVGRPELSRSAVGRIAYRVGKGMLVDDAIKIESSETNDKGGMLNFRVDRSEVDADDENRAFIIRKGLGLMMGMDSEQAETWAGLMKPGRPRKVKTDA